MTIKSSKDYSRLPNTHPAAFAANVTPQASGAAVFRPATRGITFDQSGTVVLEMAGVSEEGSQATITMTVVAGVIYPLSVDQWLTGGSGVTSGTIFW